jgi:PAS domain S-box-containing protein
VGGTIVLHEMIDSASYMAHGYCLLWKPWLVTLHAGSDFLIFASYFAIPVAIWIFVSKRPNIELKGLARLFAAFILWCGLTHIVNLVTLWWPIYEFQGLVKLVTAGISLTTAVVIFPLIPHALAIPSPNELQIANAELAREIAAHKLTLDKLEQARARLEQRVEERTKELSEATERFRSLFEHAPVAMLMADRNGAVRLMNASAEGMFGHRRDDLVGESVDTLLPEARRPEHGRLMAAFHAAPAARPMGMGRELFGRRRDGGEIPVEIGLNPLKVEGETFVVASILDISARREAEKRMQFVMRELTHRSKNLLAVIQSIARQAARHSQSIEEFHRDFADRLGGLAKSHDLLVVRDWQGAEITDLVHSQLAYLGPAEAERVEVEGEPMLLAPQAAQNLGLALHELATNSVKHGALASTAGKVRIAWRTERAGSEERRLRFVWRERDGAAVALPERMGFGHLVLEDVVPGMLGGTGTLAFEPEGVAWTLDVPLRAVLNEGRPVHAQAAGA